MKGLDTCPYCNRTGAQGKALGQEGSAERINSTEICDAELMDYTCPFTKALQCEIAWMEAEEAKKEAQRKIASMN